MGESLLFLLGTEMLKRSPLGKPIGVAAGHGVKVQKPSPLHQFREQRAGKLLQKLGHGVPPSILPQGEVQALYRLFCRLLGAKAGPFVAGLAQRPSALRKSRWAWAHQSAAAA